MSTDRTCLSPGTTSHSSQTRGSSSLPTQPPFLHDVNRSAEKPDRQDVPERCREPHGTPCTTRPGATGTHSASTPFLTPQDGAGTTPTARSLRLSVKPCHGHTPPRAELGLERTQTAGVGARAGGHSCVITDVQPQLLGETPVLLAPGKPLAADTPVGRPMPGFSLHVGSRGIGGQEQSSPPGGQMEEAPFKSFCID